MNLSKNSISLHEWVDKLLKTGKLAFSIDELRQSYPNKSEASLKLALNRLSKKEKILSIHRGYYLIIPPQYASRGIIPPAIYLDAMMKYLERPYYLGLLNAASFYGAAHQQPQEFFVFTNLPQLKTVNKKGLRVNYISKKNVSTKLIEKRKTEGGYLNISSPELTAADLIQFEKRIGGLSRAATIINELVEEMKFENITELFLNEVPALTIQRLGFILDKILNKKENIYFPICFKIILLKY